MIKLLIMLTYKVTVLGPCWFVFVQDEQAATELARIAVEFAEEEAAENTCSSKGDDLLAMMDDL